MSSRSSRARRDGRRLPVSRHVGFWAIGPVVLLANAFWWLPGYLLASTKGEGMFAMAHPESVLGRIVDILWDEAPSEPVLLGLGVAGLFVWARRSATAAAGLGGIVAAGFAWGYLAGYLRVLDPLQPGRHTYAFFTGACLAAGLFVDEMLLRLRAGGSRLDRLAALALVLIGVRWMGPWVKISVRELLGGEGRRPFLSCRATPALLRIVDWVKLHVEPGERLLFEETGKTLRGQPDPFGMHHYSAILPSVAGVEVLGGPYLYATVTTNFTQFGEGKLFGKSDWGRDDFVRYAKLYRPAAILCWSPEARVFCLGNPDLIDVRENDGTLLLGRVRGFEGATIRGKADVSAGPNRIEVRNAVAGDDGLVVLRYHIVPLLVSDPPVAIEPVYLEDDPVPFLAFRPNGATVVFRMKPAPWSK